MKRLVGLALLITLIAMPMRDEKENIPCGWALMAIRVDSLLRCYMVDVEVFHQALIEVVGLAAD